MDELYKNLGFSSHPFSKYSAEEEQDYIGEIFYTPKYYSSLLSDLKSGNSRFIIGERGSGKSALIYKLIDDLRLNNNYVILIDSFDNFPLKNNKSNFLRKIIETITLNLSITFSQHPKLINKLSSEEKELISFVIQEYFKPVSKRKFENYYNKLSGYKKRNLLKKIYNYVFNRPINYFMSGIQELVSDTIRNSLGLPQISKEKFYKNYFPELELEEVSVAAKESKLFSNYSKQKELLKDLAETIIKLGFNPLVIFLDKIDEYNLIKSSIENLSIFLSEILTDNELLLTKNIGFAFSLWKQAKEDINKLNVRFDKIKQIDVSWENEDVKKIINFRLKYFSNGKIEDLFVIIPFEEEIQTIVKLSNNSPRDLIRLLSFIYDEQAQDNSQSNKFTKANIKKGIISYIKNYDYNSVYPKKKGVRIEVKTVINRLLKIKKIRFKSTDYRKLLNITSNSANSHLKQIKNYGLIKEDDTVVGNVNAYIIIDPKVIYCIENEILEL